MRNAVVAVLVLVACGDDRPRAAPAADPRDVVACRDAIDESQRVSTAFEPLRRLSSALACGRLYRRRPCSHQWRQLTEGDGSIGGVVTACAASYCPDLDPPRPRACTPGGAADATGLEELDTRILVFEGVDARDAARLAPRAHLFESGAIPRLTPDDPGGDVHAVLSITVTADQLQLYGDATTIDELTRRAAAQVASDPDARAVLTVDADVEYSRVIAVMDILKRAGVKHIALATR